MRTRRFVIALAAVNAILIAALGFSVVRARGDVWNGTRLEPPMPTQPFVLASVDGPFGSEELRGRWGVLFFGYTRCPDACPLTLDKLRRVRAELGRLADDVQVALITVDPEHDTADVLADYVTRFDSTFIGLTADRATIEELASTWGVYHMQTGPSADGADHASHDATATAGTPFLVDHTTHAFVVDRDGGLAMLWAPDVNAEQMTRDLRRLIRQ